MNIIISGGRARLFLILAQIALIENSNCVAQSGFKERLKELVILSNTKIGAAVSPRATITLEQLENEFLQFKGKGETKARDVVFYYLKSSKRGYDGLYGVHSDTEERTVNNTAAGPTKVLYRNKVSLVGQFKILSKFTTIVISYETYDRISAFIYNYTNEGVLLSAMQILDNEKDGPDKAGEHSVISSTINKDGTIDIVTDADFRIDRKVKLDADGHFRVIEEKITRYDEN